MAKMPTKLQPLMRRFGFFRGSGEYVAKQTNIKAMKTVVPVAMGIMALGALAPTVAGAVSGSVATVPVIGPLTATTAQIGSDLRARIGL